MAAKPRREPGMWHRRLVPARLSRRVLLGSLITTTVTYVAIATFVSIVLSTYTRSMTREDARSDLRTVAVNVDMQARELGSFLVNLTEWDAFYHQTLDLDPAFVTSEIDPWLWERSGATVIVWTNADGVVLYKRGSDGDVREARQVDVTRGVVGPIELPGGAAVIAAGPVVGEPADEPAGYLILARPVDTSLLSAAGGEVELVSAVDGTREDEGWRLFEPSAEYLAASTHTGGGSVRTRGVLRAANGGPAFAIELTYDDPWLGDGRAVLVVLVPLALGLLVIGVGTWLGVMVARSVGAPLRRFTAYIEDQGYLAVQGLRTDEELEIDPRLPEDFVLLGNVISELMSQLRVNQAELIEASDQALAAERAFRTVVEESPEVKILVRDGVVEIANPAAAHFFGLHLGDLVRADPRGLFAGIELRDEQDARVDVIGLAGSGARGAVVARCVTPGQPDRWIEMAVSPIGARPDDYVISARNITEERRLEALRGEILSLVSHDLRSPLTVVRGYLDILGTGIDDDRRVAAVDSARRATIRMEGLLDDLLYATRAERVFGPTVMRVVDFTDIARHVASSLAMSSGQPVVVHAAGPVPVLGDEARLEQAVTNLVGNALKHGPDAGEVRVYVGVEGGQAYLGVEDDGPGVPDAERERIFDRGVRVAGTTAPGAGLGLYITRAIVEAHNGSATAEDGPGGRMRFVLRLPVADAPPA